MHQFFHRCLFITLLCCCTVLHCAAGVWRGIILDAESRAPIQGVVITNTVSGTSTLSDARGNFDIEGSEGQRVKFSCPGYVSETHVILKGIEGIRLTFMMKLSGHMLQEVVIRRPNQTPYQVDSSERASTYRRSLARSSSGIGSPFSLLAEKLSPRQRALFRFKKDFASREAARFVDTRYTPEVAGAVTGLTGDTLAIFMNEYPMPYDYARSASNLELKMWIRYNYRQFLQKTDSLRSFRLPE